MKAIRKDAGLTLVELIITLAISATLLMLASASWTPLTEKIQASTVQSNIQRIFTDARFRAVNSRTVITICPLTAGGVCSNNWNTAISVFPDPENHYKAEPEDVVRTLNVSSAGHLKSSNAGSGARRYFQFKPDGSARGSIGHLVWCPGSGDASRANQVRINFGGRLLWSKDENNDGIAEDASGQNINCQNN